MCETQQKFFLTRLTKINLFTNNVLENQSSFIRIHLVNLLYWFQVELEATTKEFESYKVRVHNVLKQQKSKTTQNEVDSGKLER